MLENHNTVSATVSLCCAVLSLCCSVVIVLSVHYYHNKKSSYHLQLVSRLLLTDVGLSSCIIFYFIIQFALNTDQLITFCKFYLPTVVYFFICSYLWAILLALRFLMSKKQTNQYNFGKLVSYRTVWLAPLIPAAADLVMAWSLGGITTVHTNSSDTNQSCTFNHDTLHGIIMDMITFQLPMVVATVSIIFFYGKAIFSLKNAPHSVISRQIRKASGYVAVLLIVTLPNLIYNFFTIFDETHKSRNSLLSLAVFLSSSQGFLNFCVYVWSDNNMRQWLSKHLFCFRIFPSKKEVTEDYVLEVESDEEDESNASSITTKTSGIEKNLDCSSGSNMSIGPLMDASKQGFKNIRDSVTENPMMMKKPATKGILITQSHSDSAKDSSHSVAFSVDLDRDRFVRFGENSTRFISTSTPRGSETYMATEEQLENNL